jgi:hypothetical protein
MIILVMGFCIIVLANKSDGETNQDAFSRVSENVYATAIEIFKEEIEDESYFSKLYQ